jgi:hypothetical protein
MLKIFLNVTFFFMYVAFQNHDIVLQHFSAKHPIFLSNLLQEYICNIGAIYRIIEKLLYHFAHTYITKNYTHM